MSLTGLREGLATRLDTIDGLRVHAYVPDKINPPAAVVMPDDDLADYDLTFGGGTRWRLVVRLLVQKGSDRASQENLDPFLASAGAASVRAAVDADNTLGGTAMTSVVTGVRRYGVYTVADTQYIGAELVVEILEA